MWARLLFRVRGAMPRLGALLAGWKLSVVLMALGALYYVLLAIWARSTPSHVVQSIASLLPFWVVYVLLVANTFWCLWRRLPGLARDVSRAPPDRVRPRWEATAEEGFTTDAARRLLRRMGYRVALGPEGRLWGVRRRWSALGTYLFHGALLVVALGFATTLLFRDEVKARVAVGEEFTSSAEQLFSRAPPRPLSLGPPDLRFTVDRIEPQFWGDELLFTELSADVVLSGGERATTRINRPLWLGFGTFVRLSGFGYAPRYEIRDGRERLLESAYVKMNVFPPGQRDAIRPRAVPHRLYVEVYPDAGMEEGQLVSRTLNLTSPGVWVRAYRGKLDLGERVLFEGEAFAVEGVSWRFPEIRYWGEFTILRDPGAPILFAAFLMGLAGLLLKARGSRADVEWSPSATGMGGVLRGYGSARRPPPGAMGAGGPR